MDRSLFDLNPNPVIIYDKDSLAVLEANKAFREKYGYQRKELKELTLYKLRPKEAFDELDQVLKQREEDGTNKTGVVRHCAKDGTLFYVMVSCHPYEYEEQDCRMAFIYDVTERVEAEQKAQQAYFELSHHVNESPLAMIKWDAQFNIIEWSPRAHDILGYSEEEVMGKTPRFFRFHKIKDRIIVKENISKILAGEKDRVKFDVKIYNREDVLIDLRIHGSALRNEQENLISVLTLIEDLTEQRKAEVKYQRLFENANDGIFLMKGAQFIECNDRVAEIYGCEKEDILGATPIDFSPVLQPDGQESSDKAMRKINKALDGEPQVFEWKHLKKNGMPIAVEVSLNRLKLSDDVYVQAIVRDLTEQKKAQDKLRRSEELFRKLFLKAPGALLMVDKENRVQMVNQSFENLFGYTEDELLDKDIDKVIVAEKEYDSAPRMPGKEFRDGKFYKDVVRYTKEGEPRDILLGAIPVFLDDEPIAGFGIYIDITEQKESERKLKQSLEEKQVMLEEIHHRVKNNLAIISGMLQLQAFETENKQTRNALNDGQLRIQSIGIVHELLYQSESFVDISFKEYIVKLIDTIKNTLPFDHQHIDINIETGDVSLDINQAIPSAILINELVTNAYKHAFEGETQGTIEIILEEKGKDIYIRVRDDGIGLPENFDINEYSSIGMNLVQTLTTQLDGSLQYHSDKGTEFCVVFEKKRGNNLHLINGEKDI